MHATLGPEKTEVLAKARAESERYRRSYAYADVNRKRGSCGGHLHSYVSSNLSRPTFNHVLASEGMHAALEFTSLMNKETSFRCSDSADYKDGLPNVYSSGCSSLLF